MNFKENESSEKLRGGYYTDPDIASFLLRWVLKNNPRSLLEPSCGDGVFFRCLKNLQRNELNTIYGFEIESSEFEKAQEQAKNIIGVETHLFNYDFLDWFLNSLKFPRFDAVVGNPPFIRYQYLENKQQLMAKEIFKIFDMKFTMHTNAWVPFVIASIALLEPGGRFGFVLPEELLHVLHADSLRKFFANQCSKIMIIDPQELWFENTLQGAILVLAEKKNDINVKSKGIAIVPTKNKSFLENDPEELFQNSEFQNGKVINGKWMLALLDSQEKEVFFESSKHNKVYRFDDIAEVAVGIVTGANKFFLVPDSIVEEYDLTEFAYPMFGRSEHVPNLIFDNENLLRNKKKDLPTNFIWFKPNEDLSVFSQKVKNYIFLGEKKGYPKRYKCRIREPWYSVPSVYSTSIGMLKRSHDFPRLVLNKIKAYTTDTAYRIIPKQFDSYSIVYSFINSLTVLSAELEGRHYGGGVLELVPSEIRKLVVPIMDATEEDLYKLDEIYRNLKSAEEFIKYQDKNILSKLGIENEKSNCLRNAWVKLKTRRQRKV